MILRHKCIIIFDFDVIDRYWNHRIDRTDFDHECCYFESQVEQSLCIYLHRRYTFVRLRHLSHNTIYFTRVADYTFCSLE